MIRIICDRIVSHDGLLRLIGRTDFSVAPRRGDGATNGGDPDPRDPSISRGRALEHRPFSAVPDGQELLHRGSHDFY